MTHMEKLDITKEIRGLNLKSMFTIISIIIAALMFLSKQLNTINDKISVTNTKIDRINYQNMTQHTVDSIQNHNIERRLDLIEKVVPLGSQIRTHD